MLKEKITNIYPAKLSFKNELAITLPSKALIQIWQRNQVLQKAKVKKTQHYKTSLATNAKRISLGRKHRGEKDPTKKKNPKN